MGTIKRCVGKASLAIIELGGANSCFADLLLDGLEVQEYHIVDNNELGLKKTSERYHSSRKVFAHSLDVSDGPAGFEGQADLVYSVGLIEHFSPEVTERVIETHFRMAKPGGLVIVTFPTPTWLYRTVRFMSEMLGMWIFTDERPLSPREVIEGCERYGTIMEAKTIWPIFLTQGIVAARKWKDKGSKE